MQGSFQGTAQAFQSSLSREPYLIAAALVAVYIILGILYESYVLPLTILSTLPSAGVGALLMLLMFHYQLDGDRADRDHSADRNCKEERDHDGRFRHHRGAAGRNDARSEAIRQACLLRFRPILMTTMAALLSGLPLMLENGAGSELRKPLGFSMVGGLLLSQVLTLYTRTRDLSVPRSVPTMAGPRRGTALPRLAEKMGAVAGNSAR